MAVLTLGLKNFQRQLDEACPDRHRPDGWIGNREHRLRTSGHNEDDTPGSKPAWNADPDQLAEVRALDVSADLGPDVDSQDLVDHLISLPGLGTVIRYIIHRGLIYHARNGFEPEDYTGGNAHDEHIHFEGAWSQAADNSTDFDYHLEDLVGLSDADVERIADAVWKRKLYSGHTAVTIMATLFKRTGNTENVRLPAIQEALSGLIQRFKA